jgi:hypothetical protein
VPAQTAVKVQVDTRTKDIVDAAYEFMPVKMHMSFTSPFVPDSETEIESSK